MGDLPEDAIKLFRIRKTCLKMLKRRGYLVPEHELTWNTEQFSEKYGSNPLRREVTILVERPEDDKDRLFVFFPEEEKVGVKPIRAYAERMGEENVNAAIIVVKGGITPFARTAIGELCAQRHVSIEDFKDAELMVDITEHVLVPEHKASLHLQPKTELLKRYKLKDAQLPRILLTDPVARYYGLKKGQVVKIIRPSETAGRYVTYRLCI
ncbi:unnamed protein product [Phaeothamnion confervicola]